MNLLQSLSLALYVIIIYSDAAPQSSDNLDGYLTKLPYLSYEERMKLNERRALIFEKSLRDDIDDLPKDDITKLILKYLVTPKEEIYADMLKGAMEGIGTDDKALIDILALMNNTEKHRASEAYERLNPGHTLYGDIDDETSGLFNRLSTSLLKNDRNEDDTFDEQQVQTLVEQMFVAGEDRLGTDDEWFVQTFTKTNLKLLNAVFKQYYKDYDLEVEDIVREEFSGDDHLGFSEIAHAAQSKIDLFAEMLSHLVTYYTGLEVSPEQKRIRSARILIVRSGIDLPEIKKAYELKYGSLEENLKEIFDGEALKLLQALVRDQKQEKEQKQDEEL